MEQSTVNYDFILNSVEQDRETAKINPQLNVPSLESANIKLSETKHSTVNILNR